MKRDIFSPHDNFRKTFEWRLFKIMAEFIDGFDFIANFKDKKAVTVFGSSRFSEDNPFFQEAQLLGKMLAKKGFVVITGGETGIMEAANKGAFEAGGESVGININLPSNRLINQYVKKFISFDHFFVRKVMLSFASSFYIFFPGGYGTLDEFFEILTLVQTKKLNRQVKIILVGKDYWEGLISWLSQEVLEKQKAIHPNDLKLFQVVDSAKEALKYIK